MLAFLVVFAFAEGGFLDAAFFFGEECFTTKNNGKNNGYLIKCLPQFTKMYSGAILF
jgi:hypothetical protein